MLMTILIWIVFGFVAGAIARGIYPGSDSMGWIPTVGLGVLGSFVGGFIGNLIMGYPTLSFPSRISASGLIGSVLGALLVLFIVHLARGRRRFA